MYMETFYTTKNKTDNTQIDNQTVNKKNKTNLLHII